MTKRIGLVLFLALCMSAGFWGCAKRPAYLTILYINDLHGHLEPFKEESDDRVTVGGMARIATLVKKVREGAKLRDSSVLLLCAGDVLQGTPMSLAFKGEPEIRTMNALKFSAMAIGNRDLDYGQDNLKRLMGMASFPIMSANIVFGPNKKPFATDYIINSYDDVKVAIFSLTTDEPPVAAHPDNLTDLEFLPPFEVAKELVPALRKKADVVIALTYLGHEADKQLAEEVPGIDVIIGGRSHTKVLTPARVGRTLVCQANRYGTHLGKIDLELQGKQVVKSDGILIPISGTIEQDLEIFALVSSYADRLDHELERPIGFAPVQLDGDAQSVGSRETNFGDLVADVMRLRTGADFAFIDAGSIRAGIARGKITIGDVLSTISFEHQLVVLTITGRQVKELLDRSASSKRPSNRFLQVSGLYFNIHEGEPVNIDVAGEPLDEKKNYRVATNSLLSSGGHGYSMLMRASDRYNTGYEIVQLLTEYIRETGTVGQKTEPRILIR